MNDFLIFFITFMLLAAAVAFLAALLILLANNRKEPGKRKDLRSALKNSFSLHLDAQKPLYRHLWFWVAALTPILVGISLGLPIWLEYSFSLSQAGYETFLEISKLPLYVMAPAVPLGMVVAAFHKTKQTAEQLRQTESSNNFKNYLEHKKEFIDKIKPNIPYIQNSDYHAAFAYQYFFPYAKKSDFSISKDAEEFIELIMKFGGSGQPLSFSQNKEEINQHNPEEIYNSKIEKRETLANKVSEINIFFGFSMPEKRENFLVDEACNGIISCFEVAVSCLNDEENLLKCLGMSDIRLLCFNDENRKGRELKLLVKNILNHIHGEDFFSRNKLNLMLDKVECIFLKKFDYEFIMTHHKDNHPDKMK